MGRKATLVILILSAALILGIGWMNLILPERPEETVIDQTMPGLVVTADGTLQICEVSIKGTHNTYKKSSSMSNNINLAVTGGIFVDGILLDLNHVVFLNKDDSYSICRYVDEGTYLVSANGDCIVGISEADQSILIAPASSIDEAHQLLAELSTHAQLEAKTDFFDTIHSHLPQ